MEYIITFIEGIASFVSPCVLPVIPIYISYFATQNKSSKKAILNAVGFVSGFTIIFILLGVFAGTFGRFIHEYINYFNILFGLFLLVIGFNYIGFLTIKLFNKTKGINGEKKNLNFITSCFFGIVFSLTWTPCVGAFLASALILASTTGSILHGSLLLLVYSLGLAIPFVVTTIFLEKMKNTFDFIKKHYNIINKVSGSILIFYGIYKLIIGILDIIG